MHSELKDLEIKLSNKEENLPKKQQNEEEDLFESLNFDEFEVERPPMMVETIEMEKKENKNEKEQKMKENFEKKEKEMQQKIEILNQENYELTLQVKSLNQTLGNFKEISFKNEQFELQLNELNQDLQNEKLNSQKWEKRFQDNFLDLHNLRIEFESLKNSSLQPENKDHSDGNLSVVEKTHDLQIEVVDFLDTPPPPSSQQIKLENEISFLQNKVF